MQYEYPDYCYFFNCSSSNFLKMPEPETQEVILAMPPMYHIYGITLIICIGFFRSAKLVILPRFKEATYLQTIEKYKVNQFLSLLDLGCFQPFLVAVNSEIYCNFISLVLET